MQKKKKEFESNMSLRNNPVPFQEIFNFKAVPNISNIGKGLLVTFSHLYQISPLISGCATNKEFI